MKWTLYWAALLPCAGCVCAAGALALRDQGGWGWCLLAAVVLFPNVKTGGGK